uniref:HMG box domain-containing protein n=1 Tax=Rhabditophanes sp. KR3021 TaxID=114890 RepID=A0AC35U1Q3_9BILA
MLAGDDQVDEVKLFRKQKEDVDCGTSLDQLNEDKKDVAFEAEIESRNEKSYANLTKKFAWNPNIANLQAQMSPHCMNMMMPGMMASPAAILMGSPSFNPFVNASLGLMSPSFQMQNSLAALTRMSPFYAPSFMTNNQMNFKPQIMQNMAHMYNPCSFTQNMPSSSMEQPQQFDTTPKRSKLKKPTTKPYIKKPPNAFMLYMQDTRATIKEEDEHKDKQSSQINSELAKRWRSLNRAEQQKYFDMSKDVKEKHAIEHPDYKASDFYGVRKKKKTRVVSDSGSDEFKKCRARFGMVDKEKNWCKSCQRKKKCLYYRDSGNQGSISSPNPSSFASPASSVARGGSVASPMVMQAPPATEIYSSIKGLLHDQNDPLQNHSYKAGSQASVLTPTENIYFGNSTLLQTPPGNSFKPIIYNDLKNEFPRSEEIDPTIANL